MSERGFVLHFYSFSYLTRETRIRIIIMLKMLFFAIADMLSGGRFMFFHCCKNTAYSFSFDIMGLI